MSSGFRFDMQYRPYEWPTLLLFALVFLMGLLIHGIVLTEPVFAEAEGFLVTNETAHIYRKIPEIESQLYGHSYPTQAISQRMSRIERTLFGAVQRGPSEARMQRISAKMQEKNAKIALAEQEPLLEYLEDKLFQRTYQEKNIQERIRQLEVQVFGRAFESYPVPIRIKKLTYAMPIMAKEIRLTKGDTVIARTGRSSSHAFRNSTPRGDRIQLDASGSSLQRMPEGVPLSIGDYTQAIYRDEEGVMLRWRELPIKVFSKSGELERPIFEQAVLAWQRGFSVELVPTSASADIIVTWDKPTWEQGVTGPVTRPVVQVGENRNIRTVILISMYPFRDESLKNQLHALSHQLGHAFGLWGHSNDPNDVMYPALKYELDDFPVRWAWRSASVKAKVNPSGKAEAVQPSQRDMNTLLKIYEFPAADLKSYSPY